MSANDVNFDPIKSVRTFESVAAKIKEIIFEGNLAPGDKLPPEGQLAKQFNVGRQTIREALRLLERSGFITIQKGGGGGPVISDAVVFRIKDLMIDAMRLRRVGVKELTIARLSVEKIIFDCLLKTQPLDLGPLEQNVWAARKLLAKGEHATPLNIQFHILAAEATGNHVYVLIEQAIMAVLSDFLTRSTIAVQNSKTTVDCHASLIQALKERDQDAVMSWLYRDLNHANDLFVQSLGELSVE